MVTKEIIRPKLHKTIQYHRYQRDYQNLSTQDNTMVTRRYQRDYQNLNLHTDNTMVTRRYQRDYQNLNLHIRTIQWSQEDTKEIIRT